MNSSNTNSVPKKYILYSVLSGVFLSLPWYTGYGDIFLLVGFIPLLFIDDHFLSQPWKYSWRQIFLYTSLAFFTWNILVLWWTAKATISGCLAVCALNTALYSLVFLLIHFTKRVTGRRIGRMAFIAFWVAFEYYSLHVEFSLPWVVLGNGFSGSVYFVQWYEYTGVLGGSLYIVISNVLLFEIIRYYKSGNKIKSKRLMPLAFAFIFVPIIISLVIYKNYREELSPCNIEMIQPNIDPFTEKFDKSRQQEQLQSILKAAVSVVNAKTDFILAPETAIDNDIWENALLNNFSIFKIHEFVIKHPNITFITGAITAKAYPAGAKIPVSARYQETDKIYYDFFNSALAIDTSFNVQVYHKSKMVPGIERAPFLKIFKFLGKYTINIGGSGGSLGIDNQQPVFCSKSDNTCITPVICYESVFGEYINKSVKKGAQLIFLITNDGWWGGTPGYIQHLNYARLRAIETRRSVARCANTGISAFINQRGDIISKTGWWEKTTLSGTLNKNNAITFYVTYGDYIGRVALFISICIVLILISRIISGKKGNNATI